MLKQSLIPLAVGVLLAVALAPSPALAEGSFELYGGFYVPSDANVDEDFTYGLRLGKKAETWGFQVSTGLFDADAADVDIGFRGLVDVDLWLIDFSFMYYPGGQGFTIYGGPGWATVDATARIPGENNNINVSDDAFTIHVGLAYEFNVGETFYIRPDGRVRLIDASQYDNDDYEFTLGFGWRFGG